METLKEFIDGFEECFKSVEDPRQESKVEHPLLEIIFLTLVAVAAGAVSWPMIESFGKINLELLKKYYSFDRGVPSDDTVRRVFEVLKPAALNEALMQYFAKGLDLQGKHLAIDGKSLCGSKQGRSKAVHFLNVFASAEGLTLFGKEVDEKTNEITAIPDALDALEVKGAVITIDAMGCQKDIAEKIVSKGAHYILGLKGNQFSLCKQVQEAFATAAPEFLKIDAAQTKTTAHGRREERVCKVMHNLALIPSAKHWSGLASVVEVRRRIFIADKTTESTNYYISSSSLGAEQMLKYIRNHWKIESMHWTMDVVFAEDASTKRHGNIPTNMALIRRFVLNILSQMKEKRESKPGLMKKIGWSKEYLNAFIQKLIFRS